MPVTGEKTEQINERLSLISRREGLTFGTDAYLLSAYLRRKPKGYAVDLGAGTGVLSLLCASRSSFAGIDAVEIQPSFCDIIRRNAKENRLDDVISVIQCDVRDLQVSMLRGEADAVFSNPPYFRRDSGMGNFHEAKEIARHEVFGTIADFAAAAGRILKCGGTFTVVWRPDRMSELFCAMHDAGIEPKRATLVYASEQHVPNLLLCEGKKGAAPGMFVTKPLLLYKNGGESDDLQYIYEKGAFHEQYRNP